MAVIRMSSEELDKILTPERVRQEVELAMKLPFVYDEECPPLTEERLNNFRRVVLERKAV